MCYPDGVLCLCCVFMLSLATDAGEKMLSILSYHMFFIYLLFTVTDFNILNMLVNYYLI